MFPITASLASTRHARVVLLTGGIGSGKSLAAAGFSRLGVPVIGVDMVARAIHQDNQHPAMTEIAQVLPQLMTADGCLRRGILHTVLAADIQSNRRLRHLLKPYVLQAMWQWTREQTASYVIWESALLPDEETSFMYDSVLWMHADETTRLQRLCQRNPGWTEAEIRQIFQMQVSENVFREQDYALIVNQGSIMSLEQQVLQQHLIYMSHWGNE
ncbi:dephospho-CoA kinase [Undibacterium sp. Di27W]|uniref:dephospho-CoA kinase n=1 Tax=Undibacterium sp. Di27W TaxID=3413036 RepID=UPI003BF13B66